MRFEPGSGLWIMAVFAAQVAVIVLVRALWHHLFPSKLSSAARAAERERRAQELELASRLRWNTLKRSR